MSTPGPDVVLVQVTVSGELPPGLRDSLIGCWAMVTNAGGAAGFPFPPVDVAEVAPVADELIRGLDPQRSRLIVALHGDELVGWVHLSREPNPLVAHWGTVRHLQTHPGFRGRGVGVALMRSLRTIARDELGLEQLHLAVRGGMGLEDFYGRLGWREIGRWPNALRPAAGDDRDEVLMVLDPL